MDKRIYKVFASKEMTHVRKAIDLLRTIELSIDSLDTKDKLRACKILNSIKMKRISVSPFISDWRSSVDPTMSPPGMSHRLRIIHFDVPFETIAKWLNVNLLTLSLQDTSKLNFYDKSFEKVEIKSQNSAGVSVKFGSDPFSCTLSVTGGKSSRAGDSSDLTVVNLVMDTPVNLLLEKFSSSKPVTSINEYTDRHFYSDLFSAEFSVEKYRNTIYYLVDYLSTLAQYRFNSNNFDDDSSCLQYDEFIQMLNAVV